MQNLYRTPTVYDFARIVQRAECVFASYSEQGKELGKHGTAIIAQYGDKTIIQLDLHDLPPGLHGFHIHEGKELGKGCASLGPHYNPYEHTHGAPNQPNSHLGDLGNITVNAAGKCNTEIKSYHVHLNGPYTVVGRSMIIHADPDDMGLGGHKDSLESGHSGARIACGIIMAT